MNKICLRRLKTVTVILLMAGCNLISFANVAQVHKDALVCESCDHQQAQQLAIQHAAPYLNCDNIGGGDTDNQSCTSQPKRIVVFNAQSGQAYPLEVYHTNQGANPNLMQLQTRSRNVHPDIVAMLNVGAEEHATFMAEAMQKAVSAGIAALPKLSLGQSSTFSSALSAVVPMVASCEGDRDAAALQLAFDGRQIQSVRSHIQAEFRANQASAIGRIKDAFNFNEVRLDANTFRLSKADIAVEASLIVTHATEYFTVVFNQAEDLLSFDGLQPRGYHDLPQLVFNITPRSQGGVSLNIDQEYTQIDGYPLSAITNIANTTVPLEFSYCVGMKLAQMMNNMKLVEQSVDGSPGNGSGGVAPLPGGDARGEGSRRCTLIMQSGDANNQKVVGVIPGACPTYS